jgi:hypothetical protein
VRSGTQLSIRTCTKEQCQIVERAGIVLDVVQVHAGTWIFEFPYPVSKQDFVFGTLQSALRRVRRIVQIIETTQL